VQWIKWIAREWVVLASATVAAVFAGGDTAGWVEYIFGYKPKEEWIYVFIFLAFAAIVICSIS